MNELQGHQLVIKAAIHIETVAEEMEIEKSEKIEPIIDAYNDRPCLFSETSQLILKYFRITSLPSCPTCCKAASMDPDHNRQLPRGCLRDKNIEVEAVFAVVSRRKTAFLLNTVGPSPCSIENSCPRLRRQRVPEAEVADRRLGIRYAEILKDTVIDDTSYRAIGGHNRRS
jgi:hypothetical protein